MPLRNGNEVFEHFRWFCHFCVINEGITFEYKFLDEDYRVQYALENNVAILSRYFAGIAILISCLGLFGLAACMVERRSKEIAVRKTLGCSDFGIISLLSTFFVRIIFVAIAVAFHQVIL